MSQANDTGSGLASAVPLADPPDTIELKRALEEQYWVKAEYAYAVPVRPSVGTTVWAGQVFVFALKDHPTAFRAFAWSMCAGGALEHHVALESRAVPEAAEAVRLSLLGG